MDSDPFCTFKQADLPHSTVVWPDALSTPVRDLNICERNKERKGRKRERERERITNIEIVVSWKDRLLGKGTQQHELSFQNPDGGRREPTQKS